MRPTGRTITRPTGFVVAALLAASATLVPIPAQANGCISPAPGTAQSPYLIATTGNLACLMTNASDYWGHGYHFRQTADLDMSNSSAWTHGIGSAATPFNGTYDGNGFTISNLTITSSGNNMGLFGVATGATLTGITLSNVQVSGDRQVGGLVGLLDGGTIEDASVDATVTGACTNSGFNCASGGLVGYVDDSVPTTITRSFTSGSVTASSYGRGAGGLLGATMTTSLAISNSYSASSVTGYNEVGGLIGTSIESTYSEVLSVSNSYASGHVAATQGAQNVGGLIGCFYDNMISSQCTDPNGMVNVLDTYWDTQTTGQATTAGNRGAPRTTAQMTDLGTFQQWLITDTTPSNSTTWGICSSLNGGYPFLQWYSAQENWTCSAPTPPGTTPSPTPIPASPPIDVVAQPGDATATVTWSAPASSGSYPVSIYLVTSSPSARSCLASTTTCRVTGLTNGVSYTFTVQALTGAGWSAPSEPSNAVTPQKAPSIVISGARTGRTVTIRGIARGTSDQEVTVRVRLGGEPAYADRGTVTPDSQGAFTWSMRTRKAVYAYVTADGVTSNRVVVARLN